MFAECLQFLEDNNIEIPLQLSHLDIKQVIEKLEMNPDYASGINWTISADFHDAVSKAIQEYYGTTFAMPISTFGLNYTLQNSTVYAWDRDTMGYYNCYSYALGITTAHYNPGDIYGESIITNYDPKEPLYDVNDITTQELIPLVIADLQSSLMEKIVGTKYNCIKTQTNIRPTSLGNWDNIIAMRTDDENGVDYHFAKLSGTNWLHKPKRTAILKFNNPPEPNVVWTNERYNGVSYISCDINYGSEIVYFLYKTDHDEYVRTGQHYHSGNYHYFEYNFDCSDCGVEGTTWIRYECDGPPCAIITSIEETPVTE